MAANETAVGRAASGVCSACQTVRPLTRLGVIRHHHGKRGTPHELKTCPGAGLTPEGMAATCVRQAERVKTLKEIHAAYTGASPLSLVEVVDGLRQALDADAYGLYINGLAPVRRDLIQQALAFLAPTLPSSGVESPVRWARRVERERVVRFLRERAVEEDDPTRISAVAGFTAAGLRKAAKDIEQGRHGGD